MSGEGEASQVYEQSKKKSYMRCQDVITKISEERPGQNWRHKVMVSDTNVDFKEKPIESLSELEYI